MPLEAALRQAVAAVRRDPRAGSRLAALLGFDPGSGAELGPDQDGRAGGGARVFRAGEVRRAGRLLPFDIVVPSAPALTPGWRREGLGAVRALATAAAGDADHGLALVVPAMPAGPEVDALLVLSITGPCVPARTISAAIGWSSTGAGERHAAASGLRLLATLRLEPDEPLHRAGVRWERALDPERAGQRFVRACRLLRDRIAAAVEPGTVDPHGRGTVDGREFAGRLLCRVLFLWLLESAGLLDDNHAYLSWLVARHRESGSGGDILGTVLRPLLRCLAMPPECRPRHLRDQFGDVPYVGLNLDAGLAPARLPDALFDAGPGGGAGSILGLLRSWACTANESTAEDRSRDPDPAIIPAVFEALKNTDERRRTGAFFTPRAVTGLLCRYGLDGYLHENAGIDRPRLDELRRNPARCRIDADTAKRLERALDAVRICDPAVGGGGLLVGALQELLEVREALHVAAGRPPVEAFGRAEWTRRLITTNLYGVDIDPEAVTVCRMRLALAFLVACGPPVMSAPLSRTVVHGDALAGRVGAPDRNPSDARGDGHPRFWAAAFPDIFSGARPGFDIVVVNPPYVRHARLATADREAYARRFPEVSSGGADLLVYFHLRAVEILRDGGRLAVISSSKYLRSAYGARLRDALSRRLRIDRILDFGDLPLFPAAAYPAILLAQKAGMSGSSPRIPIIDVARRYRAGAVADLPAALARVLDGARMDPRAPDPPRAGAETPDQRLLARLFERVTDSGVPLSTYVDGRLYRGVLSGLNDAFVVDEPVRAAIASDGRSGEILMPWLRGRDIKRWRVEPPGRFLIFAHHGIDIDRYPAARAHLARWRERLEPRAAGERTAPGRKPGRYRWYEIQDRVAYAGELARPKVILPHFLRWSSFSYDEGGAFISNAASFCIAPRPALTALMNSTLGWFLLSEMGTHLQSGYTQLFVQFFRRFPVPPSVASAGVETEALDAIVRAGACGAGVDETMVDDIVSALYELTAAERAILAAWAAWRRAADGIP